MKYSGGFPPHKNGRLFRRTSKVFIAILVVCLLLSTSVAWAAVTVNRASSTYSDTSPYRSYMQYRMNCYGYASHLYYPFAEYEQQPGEFFYNDEEYQDLIQSYWWAFTYWDNLYYFVKDRVFEDYGTLNWWEPTEFDISETTRTASVPSGYRKIAMSICQAEEDSDYHFYLRHSDGTWSHKQGWWPITNESIDSEVTITDSNIQTTVAEGGYDDGTRYFLTDKSAVVDFPHNLGQNPTDLWTTANFRDKAGDSLSKSYTIENSWNSRFDYPGDKDYFKYVPTESGWYRIGTDRGAGWDIDGALFDSDGDTIYSDYSTSNFDYWYNYLYADTTYYIYVEDANENVGYYILWCYKWA